MGTGSAIIYIRDKSQKKNELFFFYVTPGSTIRNFRFVFSILIANEKKKETNEKNFKNSK